MRIKSIRLTNIRSYLDEKIEFPEGSILLSGDIGSGKTTILMAIDFALFGLRRGELYGSQLLRHGKNRGSVELEFEVDEKTVKIKRTLKRNSKGVSQGPGYISINGAELTGTPTELKLAILDLIGYSQELLRKNKSLIFRYTVYTPQEDMKKILEESFVEQRLEILRKIFGIDKYGRIQENTKLIMSEFRTMQRELKAFASDLEEKKKIIKEKKKSVEESQKSLQGLVKKIKELEKVLEQRQEQKKIMEENVETLYKLEQELTEKRVELSSRNRRIFNIEKELKVIEKDINDNKKALDMFSNLEKPKYMEEEIKEMLDSLHEKHKMLASSSAVISNEIKKLENIYEKGVCETCGQKVSDPKHFLEHIEAKKNELAGIDSEIRRLKETRKGLEKELENCRKWNIESIRKVHLEKEQRSLKTRAAGLDEEKNRLTEETESLNEEIKKIEEQAKTFQHIKPKLKSLKDEIDSLEESKLLKEKDKSRIEQRLEDLNKEIETLEKEIEKKEKAKVKSIKLSSILNWLDRCFLNTISLIEKQVMVFLQHEFNRYFQHWFSILIDDETLSVRVDDRFSPIITQNGYETEYQNLSGGERSGVALAYRLALNKIINELIETIRTKDLLILDEPTDGFSNEQLDKMRDVLQELKLKQTIIVSHEPKIDTFVDNVIRLYKQNHVSKIETSFITNI
jgi:exonuclease SbcC